MELTAEFNEILNKISSKHQKHINRLEKLIQEQQKALELRKVYTKQTADFIEYLWKEGRITKEELKRFYKRK